jgi:hypothetical protein
MEEQNFINGIEYPEGQSMYVLTQVDEDGFIIDSYMLPVRDSSGNIIDYGKYYVPPTGGLSLMLPKWDFEKLEWTEGDPEGALLNAREFAKDSVGWDTVDVLFAGINYNGYIFICWGTSRTQFDTQMAYVAARPTVTTVKLSASNAGSVTFTKDQFFEIYDMVIELETTIDNNVQALRAIIDTIDDIEVLRAFPPYTEAVAKYL